MKYKYLYFDVAGTLLHKPAIYDNILGVLADHGISYPKDELIKRHKLLSEVIKFPDKTSSDFYNTFNSELLRTLGIPVQEELVAGIFKACTYQPWEAFSDTLFINNLDIPKGIISNFDTNLARHVNGFFGGAFNPLIVSMEVGFAKPDPRIFTAAIDACGISANDILFIGDSIKLDIEPALKAGMDAVLIDRHQIYPHFTGKRITHMEQLTSIL